MALLDTVSADRLVKEALRKLDLACQGWRAGRVLEETALLSRLVEHLSKAGRIDYGLKVPVLVEKRILVLHRKGSKNTDHLGSDLAVTIDVPSEKLRKTALFQLKVGDGFKIQLDRQQLMEAMRTSASRANSFVVAFDRARDGIRVAKAETLTLNLGDQASRTEDTAKWQAVVEWLPEWLACRVGESSDPSVSDGLETELASHLQAGDGPPIEVPSNEAKRELPPLIARVWIYLSFRTREPGRF